MCQSTRSHAPEEKQARKLREQKRATDANTRAVLLHRYVMATEHGAVGHAGVDAPVEDAAWEAWNGLTACVVNPPAGIILGVDDDNRVTAWRIPAPAADTPSLVSLMATPPAVACVPLFAQCALSWPDPVSPGPQTTMNSNGVPTLPCAVTGAASQDMFAGISCCMQMPGDKLVFGYHSGTIRALTLLQLLDPLFHDTAVSGAGHDGGMVYNACTRPGSPGYARDNLWMHRLKLRGMVIMRMYGLKLHSSFHMHRFKLHSLLIHRGQTYEEKFLNEHRNYVFG